MCKAFCICPEFIAKNIEDNDVYYEFLINVVALDNSTRMILDEDKYIKSMYVNNFLENADGFDKYKIWLAELERNEDKILQAKHYLSKDNVYQYVHDITKSANTTFDKYVVVNSKKEYESFKSSFSACGIKLIDKKIACCKHEIYRNRKINYGMLNESLSWSLHTIARRKYKYKKEDEYNDDLRDFLKAKNFDVKDQTREGLSESGKNTGELDLVIEEDGKNDLHYRIVES